MPLLLKHSLSLNLKFCSKERSSNTVFNTYNIIKAPIHCLTCPPLLSGRLGLRRTLAWPRKGLVPQLGGRGNPEQRHQDAEPEGMFPGAQIWWWQPEQRPAEDGKPDAAVTPGNGMGGQHALGAGLGGRAVCLWRDANTLYKYMYIIYKLVLLVFLHKLKCHFISLLSTAQADGQNNPTHKNIYTQEGYTRVYT